jgi:hypothetical protein
MTLAEPVQITQLVTEVLERLGIPYLVGGSLASSLHGTPRATQDADLVVDLKPHQVMEFVKGLGPGFHVDADMIRDAIHDRSSFNVIHLATMFKVDLFILKNDALSQIEMARRERYQISEDPQQAFFLASAEDTILRKLQWFKLGGEVSDRQWNDVVGVCRVQKGRLGIAYLQRGAQQIGVSDLLKQVSREVEMDDTD